MFDRKNQLKIPYQDYVVLQSKQLISQMTPEALDRLLIHVQSRMNLNEEPIKNQTILDMIKDKKGLQK